MGATSARQVALPTVEITVGDGSALAARALAVAGESKTTGAPPPPAVRRLEQLDAQTRGAPNPMLPSTYGRRPPLAYRAGVLLSGCVLVPLRLPLFLLCCGCAALFATLAVAGLPRAGTNARPFSAPRRACVLVVRACTRIALFALGVVRVQTTGSPAPRASAPIVVANHRGFLDAMWLFWAYDHASFVSAEEHLRVPVLSALVRAAQTITVARGDAASRARARAEIARYARADAPPMPRVIIFPEGTVTSGHALLAFKPGAFEPGVVVQPVLLTYPNRHLDVSWLYGNAPVPLLLAHLLARPWTLMRASFLPPIAPTDAERAQPRLFAARVQRAMAAALGVPCTEHAAEDCVLQGVGLRERLPAHAPVVEFGALARVYGLDRSTAKAAVREFAALVRARKAGNGNGGGGGGGGGRGGGGGGGGGGGDDAALAVRDWAAWLADDGTARPPAPSAELLAQLCALVARLGAPAAAARAEPGGDRVESAVRSVAEPAGDRTLQLREWLLCTLELRALWAEAGGSHDGSHDGGAPAGAQLAAARLAWLRVAGARGARLPRARARALLEAAGEPPGRADALCAAADANGDGALSYGEFAAAARAEPGVWVRAFSLDAPAPAGDAAA
ncbi:hypothetical protein KFE25_001579 [Diacronema lutheri]|uniref:EF-hand domain-containing protein n=1 Tax=Diacronema lutheri TaxID=2081491 RepID=A0A8J5X7E5_DIALT|nr:hypothetical protein KFE25_001579 [Diacronema lutheri]